MLNTDTCLFFVEFLYLLRRSLYVFFKPKAQKSRSKIARKTLLYHTLFLS